MEGPPEESFWLKPNYVANISDYSENPLEISRAKCDRPEVGLSKISTALLSKAWLRDGLVGVWCVAGCETRQ